MSRIAISLALVAGCTKTSERFCQLNPGAAECAGVVDGSMACTASDQCTAPNAMVCEPGSMTCVQCTELEAAACGDTTPLCGDDFRCRGCESHDECPSLACLPSGACATDDNTAFVEAGAPDGDNVCTRDAPCGDFSDALALSPRRPNIVVRGVHTTNLVLEDYPVTIVGLDGARLAVTSGRAIEVDGGEDVTIVGLTIGPPTGGAAARAVYANETFEGTLTLRRTTVTHHEMTSVVIEGGSFVLERSVIMENGGGGVRLESGATSFAIRNNFIYSNGAAAPLASATPVGGIGIEQGPTGDIEYNTLYDNGSSGAEFYGGIGCKAGTPSWIRGNIIVGNLVSGASSPPMSGNLDGNCSDENNFEGPETDVKFVRATSLPFDLHLTADTPSSIKDAVPTCAVMTDFDGQARPHGGGCDLGADEYLQP